jgi:hypothetical protein
MGTRRWTSTYQDIGVRGRGHKGGVAMPAARGATLVFARMKVPVRDTIARAAGWRERER